MGAERWLWNSYWLWRRIDEKLFNMEVGRRTEVFEALKKTKLEEQEDLRLLEKKEFEQADLSQGAFEDMQKEIDDFLSSDDDDVVEVSDSGQVKNDKSVENTCSNESEEDENKNLKNSSEIVKDLTIE